MATTVTHDTKDSDSALNYDPEKQSVHDESEQPVEQPQHELHHTLSHAIHTDLPNLDPYAESGDDIYNKFTPRRKHIITAVLSFCSFLAPISSTTVLSAIPKVAAEFNTTGSIINVSNALYLVFMGLSPLFWGPIGRVYGRRWARDTLTE
jgi:hypothetical protein